MRVRAKLPKICATLYNTYSDIDFQNGATKIIVMMASGKLGHYIRLIKCEYWSLTNTDVVHGFLSQKCSQAAMCKDWRCSLHKDGAI